MAWSAAIMAVAMIGTTAYEVDQQKSAAKEARRAQDEMNQANQKNLPDPNAAAQQAQEAQTAQRKALLASGGQTQFAGSSSQLLGDDIHSINLSGS